MEVACPPLSQETGFLLLENFCWIASPGVDTSQRDACSQDLPYITTHCSQI